MKIKLSLFFAVLVLVTTQSQGAVFQGSMNDNLVSGSAVEESNIINIKECYLDDEDLCFFAVNEEIDISKLCPIACVVSDTYKYYHCQVDWSEVYSADTSTAGIIKLKGKVVPPDGFKFSKEAEVEATALIYDDNNPTEILADVTYENDITLVHLEEDVSQYLENNISLSTISGDQFIGQIQWHNTIAPNTMGKFQAEGTIILPNGIKAEDENDLIIHRDFYAMKDDKIYIEPFYTHGGNIIFPWFYEVDDTENIKIQYSFDNNSWIDSEEDEYGYVTSTYLLMFSALLQPHKDQYFRLFYNDEYTNTVLINTDVDPVIIDGDHDGGDNYEKPLPPQIIESDSSKNKYRSRGNGASKKSSDDIILYSDRVERLEFSDLNTTVISGKRFNDLAEINHKVVFEKDGISATFDKDFIEENNLKDEDTVSVTLRKKDGDNFSIDVSINNKAIKKIPGTIIRFPKENNTIHTDNKDNVNSNETDIKQIVINETGDHSSDDKASNIKSDIKPSKKIVTVNDNDNTLYRNILSPIIIFSIIIIVIVMCILWRGFKKYAKQK